MTPELDATGRAIRAEIDAAFGQVPAAGAGEMLRDAYAGDDDAYEMAATFDGRHWTDLSTPELFQHREMIGALSGIGTRAYLPAYLAACLVDDDHGGDIHEYTLFALHPASRRESDIAALRERLSLLDDAQRAAIVRVLRHLDEKWRTFAADGIIRSWG